MGRFTIRDLRATVHLVNLWLGNFDAPFRFEVGKRDGLCTIDRCERVGTTRQCLKSGTPRDCSAACFKHFAYFASANCEKREKRKRKIQLMSEALGAKQCSALQ